MLRSISEFQKSGQPCISFIFIWLLHKYSVFQKFKSIQSLVTKNIVPVDICCIFSSSVHRSLDVAFGAVLFVIFDRAKESDCKKSLMTTFEVEIYLFFWRMWSKAMNYDNLNPKNNTKNMWFNRKFYYAQETDATLDLDKTKIRRWYKIQVVRHHGILAFGCIKKKFKNTSFMNKFQVSFLSLFYFPSKLILLRS